MEMDCAFAFAFVDEPDHCFSSLLHHKSGTRRDAIITDQGCRLLARVDLLLKFLNGNLIIIDGNAGCRIGESTLI
jgi:hypothetical protein